MKKLTAFLLCLCLAVPVLPARAAELDGYYVKGEVPAWAEEAYTVLASRAVLWPFLPAQGPITRGQFVDMLVQMLDRTVPAADLEAFPPPESGYFADESGIPRYSALYYRAAGYGILEGSVGGDGLRYVNGEDHLTREQAAKLLVSLLDFFSHKLGYSLEAGAEPSLYADGDKISAWAKPYTGTVAAYGLMKGDDRGNFNPQGELDGSSAVVMVARTLALLDGAVNAVQNVLPLQSQVDWSGAVRFGSGDYSVSRPKTGWSGGYYTIGNGDGTVSGLVLGSDAVTVEAFAADGSLASSKTLEMELPVFGAFFDSGEHFYLAFGQNNPDKKDSQEVFRIVQYSRDWERLGAVSVNGGDSYTDEPFRSAVARMAASGDGKTVTLYAARKRYDGHQSNITISMDVEPFRIHTVMGEQFPDNHVSHSFGQFIRYSGKKMVTVDHGDAYPRSFVFQDGSREVDLLKIYGKTGENVTNAIGSGFEVSDDGYLFLGCSAPQDGSEGQPWNVFLTYLGKSGKDAELTWLTHGSATVNCARLVKLDGDTFVAMWQDGADVHYQKLDGQGKLVGEEQVLKDVPMPPTDPVVIDGDICWVQYSSLRKGALLYRLEV